MIAPVTINLGTQTFLFDSSVGTDLGDYVDPQGQFVQGNIAVSRTDTPITVEFRADKTGPHQEIVVSNFKAWGAANAACAHIEAYTVTIGSQTINVPFHWWGSRWRAWSNDGITWNVGPGARPIRRTVADIVANELVLPYGQLAYRAPEAINWAAISYTKPLDNAGVYTDMPSTGARPDIGLVTDWTAATLCHPTPDSLTGLLAIAETSASIPVHVRDETTGAPVSFDQHTNANWYWDPRQPQWIAFVQDWKLPVGALKDPWQPDASHHPDLWYVAFLLTGDPFFLEEGQYTYTYFLGDKGPGPWNASTVHLIVSNQVRDFAWVLRDLINLVDCTPSTTPSWLMSKTTLQRDLNANCAYLADWASQPAPAFSVFRAGPASFGGSPPLLTFADTFMAYVFAYAVYRGHTEWRPAATWKWGEIDARLNGTSGWDWQTPAIYNDFTTITTETTWAEFYAMWSTAHAADLIIPHTNATDFMQTGNYEYLAQMRLACVVAQLIGLPGADLDFSRSDTMVVHANFPITWALSVSATSVTPTPPPPPPTPGPIMTPKLTTHSVNVGQIKTIQIIGEQASGTPGPLPGLPIAVFVNAADGSAISPQPNPPPASVTVAAIANGATVAVVPHVVGNVGILLSYPAYADGGTLPADFVVVPATNPDDTQTVLTEI